MHINASSIQQRFYSWLEHPDEVRLIGSMILVACGCFVCSNTYLLETEFVDHVELDESVKELVRRMFLVGSLLSGFLFVGIVWLLTTCIFVVCFVLLDKRGRGSYWEFFWICTVAQVPTLIGLALTWFLLIVHPIDLPHSQSVAELADYMVTQGDNSVFFRILRIINWTTFLLTACGYILCTRYFFLLSLVRASFVVGGLFLCRELIYLLAKGLLK